MASKTTIKSKPEGIQVSGKAMSAKSVPESKDAIDRTEGNPAAWSSEPCSPTEPSAVEQVMNINRRLVAQIETLRLKVEVDARQHERNRNSLLTTNTSKLQSRELEIENLKSNLKSKENTLQTLTEENQKKGSEIERLQLHIDELRSDVEESQEYVEQIQTQLDELSKAQTSLESGAAYTKKDEDIHSLQREVDTLKKHLMTLEKELSKAKERIAQQGGKMRLADIDRTNIQIKFKEELSRVTQTMRHEIEKMRDVMRQQWQEMRELREQNEDMRSDIKEIRELLIADQVDFNSNKPSVNSNVHSPFNLMPLTPSLPALSKNTRRSIPGKRKT